MQPIQKQFAFWFLDAVDEGSEANEERTDLETGLVESDRAQINGWQHRVGIEEVGGKQ